MYVSKHKHTKQEWKESMKAAILKKLFADAVPSSEFAAKNNVEFVPEVNIASDYASKIHMLYKAGVVMGSDAYGTIIKWITKALCSSEYSVFLF